jgi:rSAM/selenodomain-associated transferase 1
MLRDTIELAVGLENVQLAVAVTPPEALAFFRSISPQRTMLLPVARSDIGGCLNQVLSCLLAAGHPQAIALSADNPTLPLAHLQHATTRLGDVDVILGPSEDGGYYLIGLKQPHPELFRDIDWSTARVTDQTVSRAEALGLSVALLPSWYDVDTPVDVDRLRAEVETLPAVVAPHTRRFLERTELTPPLTGQAAQISSK